MHAVVEGEHDQGGRLDDAEVAVSRGEIRGAERQALRFHAVFAELELPPHEERVRPRRHVADLQVSGDVVVVAIAAFVAPESREIRLPIRRAWCRGIEVWLAVGKARNARRRKRDPLCVDRDPPQRERSQRRLSPAVCRGESWNPPSRLCARRAHYRHRQRAWRDGHGRILCRCHPGI